MAGRITILTGSPATGKSTISRMVADSSPFAKSVHMHTDDFYHYLRKGMIPPHLPGSEKQNEIVIAAFLKAASEFAANGYDVIVDGIIGPWFIDPWKELADKGYEVNYFILRASKEETLDRGKNRKKLSDQENLELIETMWSQFSHLSQYENNVIDTTGMTPEETASIVLANMGNEKFLL